MIVKWLAKTETLASELACSLAARALKLNVPNGALVLCEREQLPGIPARVRGGPTDLVMCYGSEYQWPDDTVARPKGAEAQAEWVWGKVCNTPQGAAGGVWDELVANEDRHHENVVFDGQRWWLIDHEKALSTVAKVMKQFAQTVARRSVIEHRGKRNQLATEMLRRRSADHKMEALPPSWLQLRQRLAWLVDQSRQWDGATGMPPVDTVLFMCHIYLQGIDLRLPALAYLLSQRMARPSSEALWDPNSNSNLSTKGQRQSSTSRRPPT